VFCPHNAFMCFSWISEQTAVIPLYSFNLSVFKNRNSECLMRGAKWVFKSDRYSFVLKGLNLNFLFEKSSNIKFRANTSCRNRVVRCGQTGRQTTQIGMTKLKVTFLNFCNVSNNLFCCGKDYLNT
jgi:hypothetical protein